MIRSQYITEINCSNFRDRIKLAKFYLSIAWHIITTGKDKITVTLPATIDNN